jgi:hypothetical protein
VSASANARVRARVCVCVCESNKCFMNITHDLESASRRQCQLCNSSLRFSTIVNFVIDSFKGLFGRYSSLADSGHGVFKDLYVFSSALSSQ